MVHRCIPQCLFVYFWPHHLVCRIPIPWPGVKPWPVAVKAWSPDPWTTREFPSSVFKIQRCLWAFGLHVAQDVAEQAPVPFCTAGHVGGFQVLPLELCSAQFMSSLHAQVYRSYCCNPHDFSFITGQGALQKGLHPFHTHVGCQPTATSQHFMLLKCLIFGSLMSIQKSSFVFLFLSVEDLYILKEALRIWGALWLGLRSSLPVSIQDFPRAEPSRRLTG